MKDNTSVDSDKSGPSRNPTSGSPLSKGRAKRDKHKSPPRTPPSVEREPKKRVSFDIPGEVASVEMMVTEPTILPSRELIEPPQPSLEVAKGINCYFVDQISQCCIMGVPLTDLVFALFSVLLLLVSNGLLVNQCVKLIRRKDIRYGYLLILLIVDRLLAVAYRCWSAAYRSWFITIVNSILALTYLDTLDMAVSLIYRSNGSYMVNLISVKDKFKKTKQWTAIPFLTAPGRLITKMKMMCLLSAGVQCWQILGLVVGLTDKTQPITASENHQILSSITCSSLLVCWAATISLPTIPVPQLFSSGYYLVLRISLKLCWLLCTAASRVVSFYILTVEFHHHLISFCAAQCVLVIVVSLLLKICSSPFPTRPSLIKLLVTASLYNLVFVHPQRGHLDHAYGLVYFLYLCENLIMVYTVLLENSTVGIELVFASLGLYTLGMICFLSMTLIHITMSHQVVRIDKREHPTPYTSNNVVNT